MVYVLCPRCGPRCNHELARRVACSLHPGGMHGILGLGGLGRFLDIRYRMYGEVARTTASDMMAVRIADGDMI